MAVRPAAPHPSVCPDEATLQRRCGKARSATVGDCLLCVSKSSSGCTATEADRFCSGPADDTAAQLVVQIGRQLSLLDPIRATLTPLAEFGRDWTNSAGSTGLGCNATHCISMGTYAMSPYCIGVFEKAAPSNIRAVPLSSSASFSAPAYISSERQWQVLDASGSLWRIDDSLTLHKIATASQFFPPYYYHATTAQTHTLPAHILWCALGSDRVAGQVVGCFNATTMGAVGSAAASCEGFRVNVATCGFSGAAGGLVCAGYNGTAYGTVGFDSTQPVAMTSALLGVDARTANLQNGFTINQFVVAGDLFVMLAQPNLGVQKAAELFVSRWEPRTQTLTAVSTAVQAQLNDGNLAWAAF